METYIIKKRRKFNLHCLNCATLLTRDVVFVHYTNYAARYRFGMKKLTKSVRKIQNQIYNSECMCVNSDLICTYCGDLVGIFLDQICDTCRYINIMDCLYLLDYYKIYLKKH